MKKIQKILFIIITIFISSFGIAHAETTDINLTIRDGNSIVYSGLVPLNTSGTVSLNDSGNISRSIDSKSVLSVINDADLLSPNFSISNLTYYDSYGSLYLKCINETGVGEKCNDWQYTVNGSYPGKGMDKNVLIGGESIYVYFGPQHKILLSSSLINTSTSLSVTAQNYNYQNNVWEKRTGVTVGLTQPNPSNTWSPIEVKTQIVDGDGVANFSSVPSGSYNVGIKEDSYFPTEALTVEKNEVNLMIRDGNTIVFSGPVPLNNSDTISLNDSSNTPRNISGKSVLSLIHDADLLSTNFSISNLTYYDSYGSLYLKCINETSGSEKCDNWQYTVNDIYSSLGMDKNVLSGKENVYVYFGLQHKITLSSNTINTSENVSVTVEDYNYQDNTWKKRTGITVGLTQPNPSNTWSPIEVKTQAVDQDGIANFSSIAAGTYNVGIKEDFYFPAEILSVTNVPIRGGNGGGASLLNKPTPNTNIATSISKTVPEFDLKKALNLLSLKQKENGSYGEDMYTDWAAISLSTTKDLEAQKEKIIKYLQEAKNENYQLTDNERRSMALMSLGINPYDVNGTNYIEKITSSYDGKQFGEKDIDNDDIFALIVLQNAGFTKEENIIKDTISYILSKQKENGSWNNSVDITGAAMDSIAFNKDNENVKNALEKAKNFLKQNQTNTGGWNNPSSTAWAIIGITSLDEQARNWIKNDKNPIDYFASQQDTDGGIKNTSTQTDENDKNKIWETSYVVTSLSEKNWNQLMQTFEKKNIETIGANPTEEKTIEIKQIEKKEDVKNISNVKKVISTNNIKNGPTNTEVLQPKRGWLMRFFGKIFGF